MADRIGQRLGNYTIVQLLGQGGFAEVYLGEHFYLKSQAAIKVLQTRLSGSDDTDSFLKEAQTIAHLAHPNIVRVMDFGIDGETPYLVMDFAPSGTLRQRHTRGVAVPLATILPYVTQIADALQYAHDEHIIHRDIKPENMLIGKRNEILLSDFGIALVAQSSRYQGTQDVIGTVAYMSPEQIQGKPRPASDQYSLGIVAYEWLTGERPFNGSFTEMCTQHMFAAPPPIREKLAQISPEVEQVIMKALDKEPKQRFESVKAFATALEQAGQSYQTRQSAPLNPSYNTVFMPSNTESGANLNPQTQQQSGSAATPAAAPYTMQQSQPFGSATAGQHASTSGPNQTSQPAQTGQGQQGLAQTGQNRSSQPGQSGPSQSMLNRANAQAELYSSTTAAKTNFDAGNNQPQQPPKSPLPGQGGLFAQSKLVLPQQPQQTPQTPRGPQPPQQRPQQGQPQTPYPNQQQHPSQHGGGYNSSQPPYQQRPNDYQQHAGQPYGGQGGQQPYQQAQPPQQQRYTPPPAQMPQQQPAALHQSMPEADEREYAPTPRRAPRTPEAHQEPVEDWLGPLNSIKWPALATLVGIILFCVLRTIRPEIYNQHIPIVLIVPLFFGAAFGPIVGILVGAGGTLVASALFQNSDALTTTWFRGTTFTNYHTWWFPLAFYGIAGLATGLSMLRHRKFPSIGSSIRATLLAVIALAAVVGYLLFNAKELRLFPAIGIVILINIAISFVLLLVYSIMGRLIDPS